MSKSTLRAGTSPFANLLAGWAPKGRRAEDEKTEDEEARKARRAEEDQKREEEDARRAEEDQKREEEDARRAEEDGTGPGEQEKDGKRGRKAEDDGDQDPDADADDDDKCADMDDKEKAAYRRGLAIGRARENMRGTRIFQSAGAAGRPDLAATIAFTTRNTSAEADRLLGAAGPLATTPAPRPNRADRNPHLGTDTPAPTGRAAAKAGWASTFTKLGMKPQG